LQYRDERNRSEGVALFDELLGFLRTNDTVACDSKISILLVGNQRGGWRITAVDQLVKFRPAVRRGGNLTPYGIAIKSKSSPGSVPPYHTST